MARGQGADPELVEGAHLGRYELVKRIAFGGMAEIFLARDSGVKGVSRNVVVKRILPNITEDRAFVDMFLDEARIAARLSHQNIVHVYDFGESEGQYYIAMEYIDGLSLSALLNACRPEPMPVEHAVGIASQIAQALYYAHNIRDDEGRAVAVVHRDVSPQNVLISYDGQVKLVDFGIAKAADQVHQTEAGVLKGKYAYMAPEQCVGLPYDHRVDIFSLGTLLHETLTGSRLFKRENAFQTMQAVTTEPVPRPSDKRPGLPARLDAIVMRALARNPKDRYPSADEVAVDLQLFLQEQRLISNQILLGRFITAVLERGDQTRPGAPLIIEPDSSPGWSSSPLPGERVSPSEVSRLRRVVADVRQAALVDGWPSGPAPVTEQDDLPSEAEGDTAQHDVSSLSELDSGWSEGSESNGLGLSPLPRAAAPPSVTPAVSFRVPPPSTMPPPPRGAAETEPALPAFPGPEGRGAGEPDEPAAPREVAPDPTAEMESPPGRPLAETGELAPALPILRGSSAPAAVAPRVAVAPSAALVDLTFGGGDDDRPTGVTAQERPARAEAPPPSPGGGPPDEPLPALWPDPAEAALAADRTAPWDAEPVRVSRFGLKGLVAVGGAVALLAFVVAVSVLGLRSVARAPDPEGPSPPAAAATRSDPAKARGEAPAAGPAAGGAPAAGEPPAHPAAPAKATIVVALDEADRLTVDGAPVAAGAARAGLEVDPGERELRVERPGHRAWSERLVLAPGQRSVVEPAPVPAQARPGKLYVNSRPWSQVFLNGRAVGATPIVSLPVDPGRHGLKLVTSDGRSERRPVLIKSGRPSKVFVEFQ